LVQPGSPLVLGVDDVDAARLEPRQDQEAPALAAVGVAGAAGVPTRVVQLVADVRHVGAVDDLAVGARLRVDVDGGQVVRLVHACADAQGGGVEDLLPVARHGGARSGGAGSAGVECVVGRVRPVGFGAVD